MQDGKVGKSSFDESLTNRLSQFQPSDERLKLMAAIIRKGFES